MTEFQVNQRPTSEPTGIVAGRVALSFLLFLGGIVLIGTGASDVGEVPWLWFVGGILAVALAFGVTMRGGSER